MPVASVGSQKRGGAPSSVLSREDVRWRSSLSSLAPLSVALYCVLLLLFGFRGGGFVVCVFFCFFWLGVWGAVRMLDVRCQVRGGGCLAAMKPTIESGQLEGVGVFCYSSPAAWRGGRLACTGVVIGAAGAGVLRNQWIGATSIRGRSARTAV